MSVVTHGAGNGVISTLSKIAVLRPLLFLLNTARPIDTLLDMATNGQLVGTYPVGTTPTGICFDGNAGVDR